jgi:hypothetical protein
MSINYGLRFVIEFLRSALPPTRAAAKETGVVRCFSGWSGSPARLLRCIAWFR